MTVYPAFKYSIYNFSSVPCEDTRIGDVVGLADDRDLLPERTEDRARDADLEAGRDPQGGAEDNEDQGEGGRRHLQCCGPAPVELS